MLIFNTRPELSKHLKKAVNQGQTIGFVPTMGALHAGHISLIKQSRKETDLTVCSIFVNPTQFNDPKDFEKYPLTLDADLQKLSKAGCQVVFVPTVAEMYPQGLANKKAVDFGFLAGTLEGEHRPGHFNGMAQIVEKLLRIVQPHKLFMGQKDYQQQLIVAQLIKRRKLKTKLITCPTLREKDGLAMSSRNVRLDKKARKVAVEISKALKQVRSSKSKEQSKGRLSFSDFVNELQRKAMERLKSIKGIDVEYFEIRNASTLKTPIRKSEKLVALTAVKIGGVRLIDNMLL